MKKRGKVAEKALDIQMTQDDIQELRQKQRSGNLFSKLGVYKAAKSVKRKILRAQRKSLRKQRAEYSTAVDTAISARSGLYKMEQKSRTAALGGYMHKRNKLDSQLASGKLDPDEYSDDMEDLEFEMPGITGVSDDYRTGDTEIMDLVDGFADPDMDPSLASPTAIKTMAEIRKRNSKQDMWVETEDLITDPNDPNYAKQQQEIADYIAAKNAGVDVDALER